MTAGAQTRTRASGAGEGSDATGNDAGLPREGEAEPGGDRDRRAGQEKRRQGDQQQDRCRRRHEQAVPSGAWSDPTAGTAGGRHGSG